MSLKFEISSQGPFRVSECLATIPAHHQLLSAGPRACADARLQLVEFESFLAISRGTLISSTTLVAVNVLAVKPWESNFELD